MGVTDEEWAIAEGARLRALLLPRPVVLEESEEEQMRRLFGDDWDSGENTPRPE